MVMETLTNVCWLTEVDLDSLCSCDLKFLHILVGTAMTRMRIAVWGGRDGWKAE